MSDITADEINEAIEIWINYEDSNRYDEDKVMRVIVARLKIKKALQKGYRLIDLNGFDTDSEKECYEAIQKLKESQK